MFEFLFPPLIERGLDRQPVSCKIGLYGDCDAPTAWGSRSVAGAQGILAWPRSRPWQATSSA